MPLPWNSPPLPDAGPLALAFVVLVALLVRYAVSLHPYSGMATPPMYGDYEAHRHWMEVTVNLPPDAWYVDGPDNDLQYWGIDYPPLSAYLSRALGALARRVHPALVRLHTSRGFESEATKRFMRLTVLAVDACVFFPAASALARAHGPTAAQRRAVLAGLLLQPALLLVDHGHFQYNCASLGLALLGVSRVLGGRLVEASVWFTLSLNFKQMSIYYAPAFLFHMLGLVCAAQRTARGRARRVAVLGATVLGTTLACWLPFVRARACGAVLRRLFPLGRHLYEDKVANVWCTLSVVPGLKLRARLTPAAALPLSLACVALGLVLPCASVLRRPTPRAFVRALVSCALSFFLFSFQVHEKHVLLPLLPACALFAERPRVLCWASAVACFSMYPLLVRDGLALVYTATLTLYAALGALVGNLVGGGSAGRDAEEAEAGERRLRALVSLSVAGMCALHACAALLPPPARYPDLWAYLFCAYACAHFGGAWLYLQLWHLAHLLGTRALLHPWLAPFCKGGRLD